MELNWNDFYYLGCCLEWFFFGMISVKPKLLLAKAVQHWSIPGLYSGIFAIYLQHRGSQSTDRARNILFYALWVLYVWTMATIIVDTLMFFLIDAVSMDDHRHLTLFQLVLQNIEYHLGVIDATAFAFCDVIAQSILVCTTGDRKSVV